MNTAFREPVVATRVGGSPESAATLNELGVQLIRRYAELERQVDGSSGDLLAFMTDHLAAPTPARSP